MRGLGRVGERRKAVLGLRRVAVNSTHPDYDAAAVEWSRARDVLSGEDAVKAGGEKYLPRLDSQSEDEFAACVKRTAW